jgi:hypothetical protein
MKSLSSEQLNQYPPDFRVWVVVDKAEPDGFLLFPMNLDDELGLFAFLEQQDAEHMARMLKGQNKNYKDMELEIRHDILRDLGTYSVESKTPLCVLDSQNAMDFFTRYPDSLDGYYGY